MQKLKTLVFFLAFLLATTTTVNAGWFDFLNFFKGGEEVGSTLYQLSQWKATTTPVSGIAPNVAGKTIYAPYSDAFFNNASTTQLTVSSDIWFTGLTNCDTIDTDAYGLLSCGTDASGSGGTGSNWGYETNYGADALTPTSTIPVWFKDAVYATSTIHADGNITGANLNISNWDTAHGWGDHSGVYDILGQATSTLANHTTTYNHANYDTAYGWSNHADAGYNLQAFASSTYAIAGGAFHDGFSDFVANEHLDWTQNVGTIHAGNYTDTNTTYTSSDFTHDDLTGFVANEHLDWTSNVGTIDTGNYVEDVPHTSISALNALFTSESVASTTNIWADAYISSASTWNAKMDTTDIDTIAEINAILSTENVASTTNVWADSYISSASTWNAKWDALTDMVLTDNYIYVGDASNDPVGVAMSNDCTIASNGAITCDHDALDNFVANEHINWTADQGATNIHSGNYTALTNLTDFDQTAWRLFYSNNLGDVVELSLGTDGQYLKSQGGTSTLTWGTPIDTTYTGGTNLTLVDTTFNVDDAFLINSGSDIAGTGSGFTWGFNASAGSDPVMTFGDGIINVTTGALQVGGAAVQTGADLVDDAIASCANANACTLTADAITDNLILLADFAHSQDYGDFTIGAGESFTLDTGTVADNEIDYANVTLADFDYQTAWRVFYSNTDGDVTELALGADGTYLKSNGAAAAPTFEAPAGGGDVTQVFDCATGDCNTMTVGTSEYLTYGTGYIDANRFAGVTTVSGVEFEYINGVTSAIQTQFAGKQGLDAQLTDLADGTLTGNFINTANPWADNEVSDTLTVTGYMQDTDIDTLVELNAWLGGESVASTTQVWADAYVDNNITIDLATLASTITVADESADTSCYLGYFTGASGSLAAKTGTNLTFNSNTGILTASGFAGDITGALTGNADTVTGFTPASGSLTLAGADALTITTTAATGITLPTSGTMAILGGNIFTGVHNFGGATSIEIPNAAAPVVDTLGEIGLDTTNDQIIVMGASAKVIPTKYKIWSATIASTSPAFIDGGLLAVPVHLDGYTMTEIRCKVDGGTSKVVAVEDASANSTEDIVCTTSVASDDGSITNAAVTAAEEMYIDFGASVGTVNTVSISVFGLITRE